MSLRYDGRPDRRQIKKLLHVCQAWDYSFLYKLMAHQLRNMAEYAKHHGHTVNSPQVYRECLFAARLCEDIANGKDTHSADRYYNYLLDKQYGQGENEFTKLTTKWDAYADKLLDRAGREEKDRLKQLHHLMARRSLTWWD